MKVYAREIGALYFSVVGPGADVRIPRSSRKFDYELELGIFIGRKGRDIPRERAHEHIAGFTIFNDFSARDVQMREITGRLGPAKGKDFDTGNAMGPYLVTPDEVPDPYALTMTARVNGEERSRGTTAAMHYRWDEVIAYVSRDETLHPGEFIGSGTVGGGCGLEHERYLAAGDVVELEVLLSVLVPERVVAKRFEFAGIAFTPPTETFSGTMTLRVGGTEVRLIEVGPAHTRGDLIVHVPSARVVFAGDILFHQGHPIVWTGPFRNWIRAFDLILEMDVAVVVPGHGPLADKAAVRKQKQYLEHLAAEARKRFDAGQSVIEAALDIPLDDYAGWGDAERVVANVDTLYREFRGDTSPPFPPRLFAMMATVARARKPS